MSLITRCPACRTMFKVVPDQLRVSEGWVRCGKCGEIFDAAAHLQGASAVPAAPREESAMAPQVGPSVEKAEQRPSGEPAYANTELLPDVSAYSPTLPAESSENEAVSRAESREPPRAGPSELSFMRGSRRSRWKHPLVRTGLGLISLLLALSLLLQLLVQERDRVATVEPRLKPLVEEACAWLECQVAPLRQIESVAIDSSSFNKIRGDVYRLSLTIKNNAPIDLATPAIELSLTDTLDQPLMRRVFKPDELGLRSAVIAAGSETNATLVLSVKANGNAERVAGYRLLAFYP